MGGAGASAVTGEGGNIYVVGSDIDQTVEAWRYQVDSDIWTPWVSLGVDLYETSLVINRNGDVWAVGGVDPDPGACSKLASSDTLVISTTSCPADINSDNAVNVTDLLLLLAAWGVCP